MCKSVEKQSRTRNELTPVEHHRSPPEHSLEGLLESRLRMLQSAAPSRVNYDLNELNGMSVEELEEKLRVLRCENASSAYRRAAHVLTRFNQLEWHTLVAELKPLVDQ